MPVEMVESDGGEKKERTRLTDPELRQLAQDLFVGKVYTDRHIPQEQIRDRLQTVFLPILWLDAESFASLQTNPPEVIYEYLDKAAPRMLWGLPVFLSMKILTKEEADIMWVYYNKCKEALETVE